MNERDQHVNSEQERLWVEQAQKDPRAFEPIFHKYHDTIFNYALRRLCDASLAQDITASTFMKALDKIADFEWQGISIGSWLYRIATNEINQNHRKLKRIVPLTTEVADTLTGDRATDAAVLEVEERLQKNERFRKVCSALSKIKLKYQTVLSLRYFEEKSIKEVAEILDMNENTVKTQIRRGLESLRNKL